MQAMVDATDPTPIREDLPPSVRRLGSGIGDLPYPGTHFPCLEAMGVRDHARRQPRWGMHNLSWCRVQQRSPEGSQPVIGANDAAFIREARPTFDRRLVPGISDLPYPGTLITCLEALGCSRKRDLAPIESTKAVPRTSILFFELRCRTGMRFRSIQPENRAKNVERP